LANVLTFEPNKANLRELLATQIDLTTPGAGPGMSARPMSGSSA
jgi:hypothetical protein